MSVDITFARGAYTRPVSPTRQDIPNGYVRIADRAAAAIHPKEAYMMALILDIHSCILRAKDI